MSTYGRTETIASDYGVTKAIIAEVFGISRSAVTQSCACKTVDKDLENRIYWVLRGFSRNIHAIGKNAQDNSLLLLSRLRDVMARREKAAAARIGRPTQQIKFSVIKRLVRQIVATLWKPVAAAPIQQAKFEHKRINKSNKYIIYLEDAEFLIEQAAEGIILGWYGYHVLTDHIIEYFGELTIESAKKYFQLCVDSGAEKDYNW